MKFILILYLYIFSFYRKFSYCGLLLDKNKIRYPKETDAYNSDNPNYKSALFR